MADLSEVPWNEFPLSAAATDRVSPHFQRYELTRSELAARQGINNDFPDARTLRRAVYLSRSVLEPVREAFGRYSPNSVFRCQDLERALKRKPKTWRSTSQHTAGQACDIEVHTRSNLKLAEWIRKNLEFDQLILECYSQAEGPHSGWVHVSVRAPGEGRNRRQVLSYVRDPGSQRYVYVEGLRPSP